MSGECSRGWDSATGRKRESTVETQWTGKLLGERMRMSFPGHQPRVRSNESLRRKEMSRNSQQEPWRVNQPRKRDLIVGFTV